jgi:hypothetical protein
MLFERRLLVAFVCATVVSASAQPVSPKELATFVKSAKAKFEGELKDPESVRYRALYVSRHADGLIGLHALHFVHRQHALFRRPDRCDRAGVLRQQNRRRQVVSEANADDLS